MDNLWVKLCKMARDRVNEYEMDNGIIMYTKNTEYRVFVTIVMPLS